MTDKNHFNKNLNSNLQNDGLSRCNWPYSSPKHLERYLHYHDTEWGVPCFTDSILFEKLILESNQAGLSWITILVKRDNFRKAYEGFKPEHIAQYTDKDIERLMQDRGIIRNRAKIKAAIGNSQAVLDIQQQHSSFSNYLWDFVDGSPILNKVGNNKGHGEKSEMVVSSDLSDKLSKDLKQRGCKFTGTVMVYSFMQSMGMINDHDVNCHRYEACQHLRR